MKSDYSYIAQLSSKDKKEKERFILWLPGNLLVSNGSIIMRYW
ncbi:hypothetical protein ABID96_002019 [Bacillus sp. OAE603]